MRSVRQRNVFLISIGSELLKGETINSNLAFLGRVLFEYGYKLAGERSVPDNPEEIGAALDEALSAADYVITCGGLGPTFDDITRKVIAAYFNRPLKFSASHYKNLIMRISKKRKLSRQSRNGFRLQCYFPEKSSVISNAIGSAWGFSLNSGNKKVISLPGVPQEFEGMLLNEVVPKHLQRDKQKSNPACLIAKTIGLSEVDFMKYLGALPPEEEMLCGIYPDVGEVRFSAVAAENGKKSAGLISKLKSRIEKKLKKHLYSMNSRISFEEAVANLLSKKRLTVSCAESCTGGYASKLLTNVPGSSKYFVGGVIAYSNRAKQDAAGIDGGLIKKYGAVSEQIAGKLAENIRKIMNTSYGIGITGIAGPGGGSRQKPVGLVYIGLADSKYVNVQEYIFRGNRERIRLLAAKQALYLLWRKIKFGSF